jgi:hypothetical protein
MSKGTVNIPITHYDDLKSIIGKWKESHTQAINKIAELEVIVKAVAHIGVDFGYGKYELEPGIIDDARTLMEQE